MRETATARWQHYLVSLWRATIGMRMTVKTEQPLQGGGAPEYAYHDRTAWRCAVIVGKSYGSKGYPQRNAAHVRRTLLVTSSNPLKQHLSRERFPDNDAVEWAVCVLVQTATTRILRHRFPGASETVGQVFKFVVEVTLKNKCCLYVIITISFF